jgi:hypothetical protein
MILVSVRTQLLTMANKAKRHCVICDSVIIPNTKYKSLAVKPKDMEITFYEVADIPFFLNGTLRSIHNNSSQPRILLLSPSLFKENRFLRCGCGLN